MRAQCTPVSQRQNVRPWLRMREIDEVCSLRLWGLFLFVSAVCVWADDISSARMNVIRTFRAAVPIPRQARFQGAV